jgi:hypothetical protein
VRHPGSEEVEHQDHCYMVRKIARDVFVAMHEEMVR